MIDGEYSVSGWNRYSYVSNNPILYKDLTGHYAWSGTGFDPAKPCSNDAVDSTGAGYYAGAVVTTGITGFSAAGSLGTATPAGVTVGVAAGALTNYLV
ncbi:MAG: hypothetical protein JXK07_11615 [Spirochaetes bacterium]|nr:hypothetical protein [Spirochaetota bacterium]MBN2769881.1 hypothetical protein [Spirochaetota bacterium]